MKRRRRKEKHEEREKSILKNSFKRRRSGKIGDTRIEYKRDVNHKKNSKSRVFFFLESQKMKLEMQKATKKVQKKKEKKSKTLVLRKKEKWNKKRQVFFKKTN